MLQLQDPCLTVLWNLTFFPVLMLDCDSLLIPCIVAAYMTHSIVPVTVNWRFNCSKCAVNVYGVSVPHSLSAEPNFFLFLSRSISTIYGKRTDTAATWIGIVVPNVCVSCRENRYVHSFDLSRIYNGTNISWNLKIRHQNCDILGES